MNKDFNIKFWGVRGSYPTPGANTVKYGGNTACVEINAGGRTIILDAGTGIIPLGRELVKRKTLGNCCCCSVTCITTTRRDFHSSCLLICRKHKAAYLWSRRHSRNGEACVGAQSIFRDVPDQLA
jgi:hypothetical protein